jgi:hypothetical protein
LFKAKDAAQYVPVYDEKDQLVGSLGLDASGKALGYMGQRMEGYEGLGSQFIQPAEMPQAGGGDDDRPSPISAEAVGVTPEAGAGAGFRPTPKLPQVPLPSALEQTRPAPQQPITKPTPIPAGFGQQPRQQQQGAAGPAIKDPQGGIMTTLAAQQQQEMYPFMYGNEYQRNTA